MVYFFCEAGSVLFVCARYRIRPFSGLEATLKTLSLKSITVTKVKHISYGQPYLC